jgi:hypothetical protein
MPRDRYKKFAAYDYSTDRYLQTWDLCRLFNEGYFEERAAQGEFETIRARDNPLTPTEVASLSNVKPGAKRETILYRGRDGKLAVEAFQYRNPDGSLGGRGKRPDPKTMIINQVKYHRAPDNEPPPRRLAGREINAILGKSGRAAIMTHIETMRGHYLHYQVLCAEPNTTEQEAFAVIANEVLDRLTTVPLATYIHACRRKFRTILDS